MNIYPPYPPASAPQAPVPHGPGPWPRAFPDGIPASPAPGSVLDPAAHFKGYVHGIQRIGTWKAGENKPLDLIDEILAPNLWRVTAFGPENMKADLLYGTSATIRASGLALPLRVSVPGQVALICYPVSEEHETLEVRVTVTPATSGGLIELCSIVTRVGADVPLDPNAFRFTALTASTLTIRGTAVVVSALSSVRLVAGSVLTGGTGYQEFDA